MFKKKVNYCNTDADEKLYAFHVKMQHRKSYKKMRNKEKWQLLLQAIRLV